MKKKIVFFAALAAVFVAGFFLLLRGVQGEILREKVTDLNNSLRITTAQAGMLAALDYTDQDELFLDGLVYQVELLDRLKHTYAAVMDEGLSMVSERYDGDDTVLFDPLKSEKFLKAAGSSESGIVPVKWKEMGLKSEGGPQGLAVHVCYEWVTSPGGDRYLLAAGISRRSIYSPALGAFIGFVLVVFSAASVLMLGSVGVMLFRLGFHRGVK